MKDVQRVSSNKKGRHRTRRTPFVHTYKISQYHGGWAVKTPPGVKPQCFETLNDLIDCYRAAAPDSMAPLLHPLEKRLVSDNGENQESRSGCNQANKRTSLANREIAQSGDSTGPRRDLNAGGAEQPRSRRDEPRLWRQAPQADRPDCACGRLTGRRPT
nr:uncharacterized protein LOC111838235 isoform X2 [Paramormyrops kingsleyae]